MRETVYNGLLKRARAKLHTEFVRWADKLNADNDRAQEFEAILGYHLEQAYKYLGDLGPMTMRDRPWSRRDAASGPPHGAHSRAATCTLLPVCSNARPRCFLPTTLSARPCFPNSRRP